MAKYRTPLANSDVIHLVEQNKEPEQKLWIAVLAKAFDDAFYSTDDRAALEALSWIRHGIDFNYVCQLAGRDPNYVRKRMLDKVIAREAHILMEHERIKKGMDNVIKLKNQKIQKDILAPRKKRGPAPGTVKRVYDYKWIPKQTHDYVDR